MLIAALQFDVRRGDVAANLLAVERGLQDAAQAGVELLLLPELWSTSFLAEEDLAAWISASEDALQRVRELSGQLGVALAGSSLALNPGGLPFNRMQLFDGGQTLLVYDKLHLFSPTAEHLAFAAGSELPPSVEWRGWKLAMGVCYDLRFPRIWRRAFEEEAELLLISAQWPVERAHHWQALLRGRAVEHQAFCLGANRTGLDRVGRRQMELRFSGNSMVVSPHGEVLAEGKGQAGLVVGRIESGPLKALRRDLPVRRDQRRL